VGLVSGEDAYEDKFMQFGEYSPQLLPSLDEQKDALQKGMGRAWQWAQSGRLADQPLLEACLRDHRFDTQCEGPRGDWLWNILQTVDGVQRFRVPILHALYELADERSAHQLCELARCYAALGDESFRDRLYEIVEQKTLSFTPCLGEYEIIALDGEKAFLFAARLRGQQFATRQWEYDDESPIAEAIDRFGEEHVSALLGASADESLRRYHEAWRQATQKKEARRPQSQRERMRAIPVEVIIREAESESNCYWFRPWGIHADEATLCVVLESLWTERRPEVIAKLLRVFANRALPAFDARLIELCRHADDDVRRWALRALERNADPRVREHAVGELQMPLRDWGVVALFIKNYEKGDEHLILEAMQPPADACELHWLLKDVTKVLEKNPEADCTRLALIAYALTPCENCRFDAARLLHNQHVAPDWLLEECRFDSNEDCRKLVGG
jgi:hypothetical protein